jgi:hypothetical protein
LLVLLRHRLSHFRCFLHRNLTVDLSLCLFSVASTSLKYVVSAPLTSEGCVEASSFVRCGGRKIRDDELCIVTDTAAVDEMLQPQMSLLVSVV